MSRVLVIAGGKWQLPLVKMLKTKGHFVINTNLYENSECFSYSDIGVVADVLDINKNIQIAQDHNIDAVMTDQSDIAVLTAATVAEKAGLKGIGVNTAKMFTNKYLMRSKLKPFFGSQLKFELVGSIDEALRAANFITYPCIIKPIDNQSSRGVFKVNSGIEMKKYFNDSLRCSQSKQIIVEQFVPGFEVTVEGIKLDSMNHRSIAVSLKDHFTHNSMIASSLLFQQEFEGFDVRELKKFNDQIIDYLGLPFGLTHAEYKIWNGKFYLVEVAARGGGSLISSHIAPLMSGIDSYSLFIDTVLQHKCDLSDYTTDCKTPLFCKLQFISFDHGKARLSNNSLTNALLDENIVHIDLNVKNNEPIKAPTDDRSRHGFILAKCDNILELECSIARASKILGCNNEPNSNL